MWGKIGWSKIAKSIGYNKIIRHKKSKKLVGLEPLGIIS